MEKEFRDNGEQTYVIIDGQPLAPIQIREGLIVTPKTIEEAFEYLSMIPGMNVISTSLIATGVDPKPLASRVLDAAEEKDSSDSDDDIIDATLAKQYGEIDAQYTNPDQAKKAKDKLKSKYVVIRLKEGQTIQDVVTADQLGKNFIVVGRTKADLLGH